MKNLFSLFLLLVFAFSSCDKVKNPIQSNGNNPADTTQVIKRRILIEEFTGQLCTFCPDGAREIERLIEVYGTQIIPISIHAGSFAEPGNGAWNDFTTTSGDIYLATFGVSSYPAAAVSRINNAEITGKNQWESKILTIKDEEPFAEIKISNTFNSTTKKVDISIETEWLKNAESSINYKLQVYIIENHIVAKQIDNGVTINDYDHKHVLRTDVNTSWGDIVSTSLKGEKETFTYSYTLDPTWKENDCEVIAFIYKEGPNYEVMQAAIKHVVE